MALAGCHTALPRRASDSFQSSRSGPNDQTHRAANPGFRFRRRRVSWKMEPRAACQPGLPIIEAKVQRGFMRWSYLWTRVGAAAGYLAASAALALAGDTAGWASGSRLREQLDARVGVSWDNVPLDRVCAGLARSQQVAILRDRRLDPGLVVRLAVDGRPLADVLAEVAAKAGGGYCQLGPVAYLGPAEMAAQLRTLAALRQQEARKLPAAARRKLLQLRNWHWDRLAEPRELAQQLAAEADVQLIGAERIAHDLWPAADLPPLKWIDRLTLLAAQFNLTYRIEASGRRVRLVDLPQRAVLVRTYRGGQDPQRLARDWATSLPDAKIEVAGQRVRVAGRLEHHEHLQSRLRGRPTRRVTTRPGAATYQLAVERAALDQVVAQLEKRLNLSFDWRREQIDAAGIAVDQLISVKVTGATLDGLLEAVFADTKLEFERSDRGVEIRPR